MRRPRPWRAPSPRGACARAAPALRRPDVTRALVLRRRLPQAFRDAIVRWWASVAGCRALRSLPVASAARAKLPCKVKAGQRCMASTLHGALARSQAHGIVLQSALVASAGEATVSVPPSRSFSVSPVAAQHSCWENRFRGLPAVECSGKCFRQCTHRNRAASNRQAAARPWSSRAQYNVYDRCSLALLWQPCLGGRPGCVPRVAR
ncbi:hypothetical protein C8Q78DRAFT_73443 [Trametes maxima]|nr:hypothetical protein C8Q78DRAFT_73443 [Trametes maxima]